MKKKQLIAFASAMALAVTSLAGCGKSEFPDHPGDVTLV